nr:SAM-dependent methyltransferase [Buchnera aphidicola]
MDILKNVSYILTENIQHTLILLKHYSIVTKLLLLNIHNEHKKSDKYIKKLTYGKNIALVSKAGTPLINDPGSFLINNAYKNNIRVVPLPGACAAITALSASGLNINKFCYEGFLSHKNEKRKNKYII